MAAVKKIKIRRKPTAEGKAMDATFKKATERAQKKAFQVRKTILMEKDGWLVMVDKNGKVRKRVKRLPKLVIPAA